MAEIFHEVMTRRTVSEATAIADGHDFSRYRMIVDVGGVQFCRDAISVLVPLRRGCPSLDASQRVIRSSSGPAYGVHPLRSVRLLPLRPTMDSDRKGRLTPGGPHALPGRRQGLSPAQVRGLHWARAPI